MSLLVAGQDVQVGAYGNGFETTTSDWLAGAEPTTTSAGVDFQCLTFLILFVSRCSASADNARPC
jgi:hypothetical protein